MKLLLDVYLPSSHLYISVLVFLLIYLFLKLLHVVQLKEKMCYVSSVNAFYPPFFGLKESVLVFKDGGLDIIEKHDFGHSYSRKIWQPLRHEVHAGHFILSQSKYWSIFNAVLSFQL